MFKHSWTKYSSVKMKAKTGLFISELSDIYLLPPNLWCNEASLQAGVHKEDFVLFVVFLLCCFVMFCFVSFWFC